MDRQYYWHFCRNDKRLGFCDERHIKIGRTLKIKGKPVLCQHGLHASRRIIDALKYSQGNIVCKVQLGGEIVDDDDKSVAQERTVVAWCNAEQVLHEFACRCAERALKKANITDKRCWDAIKAKRQWLKNEINDKELDAAKDAAWDAARSAAAAAAAWDAAWAAAWDAAGAAAWDAARSAAWDAAGAAAWDAARSAAKAAARAAAGAASWADEKQWQNKLLSKMVTKQLNHGS